MGRTPQPPRPPAPSRSGSNLVAIVLVILALVVVVSGLAIWTGVRFLSSNVKVQVERGQGGQKDVSVKTPVGDLEVHKQTEVSEARLGLPFYPGAQRVADNDSVALDMNFPGQENLRVVVGKFETSDPIEKVKTFYQQRLGHAVSKFIERDPRGKMVFEIQQENQERVVALQSLLSGTRIELVRVTHGPQEVN